MSNLKENIRLSNLKENIRVRLHDFLHPPCRSCKTTTWILEDVCKHCGTYAPCRVPYSTPIIVALLSVILITLIGLAR